MKFVGIETINMGRPYELWYGADSDGDFEEYARCSGDEWYNAWNDDFTEAEHPTYLEESRRDAIEDSIASETQGSWDGILRILTSSGIIVDVLPNIRQYFIAAHPLIPQAVERDEMVRDMRYGDHNFDNVSASETNFDGVQGYGFVNIFSRSYDVRLIDDDDKFWMVSISNNWGHYGSPCVAIMLEAIVGRDYVLPDDRWRSGSAICLMQLITTLRKPQKVTETYLNPGDGALYRRTCYHNDVVIWEILPRDNGADRWQQLSTGMMELEREIFHDQIIETIPFEEILRYAERGDEYDFGGITAGKETSGGIFDCGSYSNNCYNINVTRSEGCYRSTRYYAPGSRLARWVAFRIADDLKNEKIMTLSDYMME